MTPTEDLLRDLEDLETGRFQGFRARRAVNTPSGGRALFWVTMRTVEISDERMEVTIFLPEAQLGQLGRHPTRAWMDVIPICLGIADRHWRIQAMSAEVYELLGKLLRMRRHGLLDWVDPAQRTELSEATVNPVAPGILPNIGMATANGAPTAVCVMLAPTHTQEHDLIDFALVGRLENFHPSLGRQGQRSRDASAEDRGRGEGGRSHGLFVGSPRGDGQELTDLTTRQWEILTRIAEGQRVSTIASGARISARAPSGTTWPLSSRSSAYTTRPSWW